MIGCVHATAPTAKAASLYRHMECSSLLICQSQELFDAIMTRTRGPAKKNEMKINNSALWSLRGLENRKVLTAREEERDARRWNGSVPFRATRPMSDRLRNAIQVERRHDRLATDGNYCPDHSPVDQPQILARTCT
jgi:hypothetical protein